MIAYISSSRMDLLNTHSHKITLHARFAILT